MQEVQWIAEMWEKKGRLWYEKPVPIQHFIEDEQYIGLRNLVYPGVMEDCIAVVEGEYRELVDIEGYGSGKSFKSQLITLYKAYELLCIDDPHEYFGLARDKPITCVNMGLTETQAMNVIFRGIRTFVAQSPWFQLHEPEIQKKSVNFGDRIHLMSGNSQESTVLGYNIYSAILDEASFYYKNDKEERDTAEDLYEQLTKRMTSRFGDKGFLGVITSTDEKDDFGERRYREAATEKKTYRMRRATWEAKPRASLSPDVFVFDHTQMQIVDPSLYGGYQIKDAGKVAIDITEERARTLRFNDGVLDADLWIIPRDYERDFRRNPEKSAKDLGSKPYRSGDTFIRLEKYIDLAVGKHVNPVSNDGKWHLPDPPKEPLFIHLDLGLNRERGTGRGDCAGFVAGYFAGYDKDTGMARVRILLCEQITAGGMPEIKLKDVRQRIAFFEQQGFEIEYVTMDGWQSADTQQEIESWDINVEQLSVDKDTKPYESLKESLYARAVELPSNEKNRHVEVVQRELRNLRVLKGKVDHPKDGSKDVSDSLAGVVFKIKEYYGRDDGSTMEDYLI